MSPRFHHPSFDRLEIDAVSNFSRRLTHRATAHPPEPNHTSLPTDTPVRIGLSLFFYVTTCTSDTFSVRPDHAPEELFTLASASE